ncbi:Asp23/Gls24 family envelope stress response protein [Pediococcus pentosaceus]|uniref:Stress response regulator gls24 homolog n=1 Tax=Pediococcus pentosaceus TaxID=1255 RepID=A0AB73HCS6_PEDPE|nr:Asp23/Gls24 family envelope stress response protein [Pediococcus pentosaceus]KAF0467446.1 Asp23/Gls24 family envelope stress response protein [Pediococcus pentosaceus]MBF7114054.1 Asp23/Gls24 family envelope stress response protein [Pediococcus pentosaceus]MCM6792289.1 Asp23/Gls24 family envelope stress response protein [Pediococcus pentosaceus]MCM6809585.1 Asp23/Gls24 family envelope stress response protein [Pediococcus pentosaceus]MCM6812059.1 Asp23/Gls24 family envelope stress response p
MDKVAQPETKLTFDDEVLAKIAGKTASNVDGVLSLEGNIFEKVTDRISKGDDPTTGVNVDIDDENQKVSLKMDALLEYGKNAQSIFDKMVTKITAAVNEMTNMEVAEIKLNVKDVLTHEEWADRTKDDKKHEDKKH